MFTADLFLLLLPSKKVCRDKTWSDDVIDVSSFERIVRHKFTTFDVRVLKHVTSHSKQTKSGRKKI